MSVESIFCGWLFIAGTLISYIYTHRRHRRREAGTSMVGPLYMVRDLHRYEL